MSQSGADRLEFEVFSLFPELLEAFAGSGLLGKAVQRGLVGIEVTNYRDFTDDKHRTVDDTPFGGGGGMVIKPEPVHAALEHVEQTRGPFHRVLLTPSAPTFDQRAAERLSRMDRIGLLCGRYEGIDDRIREHHVDECLSIGDFVLNGGEVAAIVIIEAVSRLREGVLGNPDSAVHESFGASAFGPMLEHPHYTRPVDFRGHRVPDILTGGDHRGLERWRLLAACERTWALRPELRPAHGISPGHPVFLVLDDRNDAAALPSWARTRLDGILTLDKRRELVRRVRRTAATAPQIVGLGERAKSAGCTARSTPALVDMMAIERGEPLDQQGAQTPPILFVWPEPAAAQLGANIWFAPPPAVRSPDRSGDGLATDPAMIDISQPRSGEDLAPLAHALCEALSTRPGL